MKIMTLAASALLLTAVGCGDSFYGDDENNTRATPTQTPQNEEDEDQGYYIAQLSELNPNVVGNDTTGTAYIRVQGDEMQVFMNVNGSPKSIAHIQHIHTGSACPTTAADVNADGFVDVVEGVPAYGPILVNLDSDLASFDAGSMRFPKANAAGVYSYNEKTSFNSFLTDLQQPDQNPDDAIVKLGAGEALNLASRHIVVHGVPMSANLPTTVASLGEIPSHITLPVACGTITRMTAEEQAVAQALMDNAGPTSSTGTVGGDH